MTDIADAITGAITKTTAKWAKQRKAEERDANARRRREQSLTKRRDMTIKEAAFAAMLQAYEHASGNGRFYANARQIMYAARPLVLELTGGRCWAQSSTFTQQYLPDYIEEEHLDGVWKIAYDARGHLVEPHRHRLCGPQGMITVPLGTMEVRSYVEATTDDPLALSHLPMDFPTAGPVNRYSTVVFIEKEGFDQQITQSGLADRYDVSFMSTKGMSVTAARELVDHLAGLGIRLLIVHDFDRAGFTIAGTLTKSSRRYRFRNDVDFADLGLRLSDVREHELQSEPWAENKSRDAVEETLRRHGATDDEIEFLVRSGRWDDVSGERVELNAFTTEQFIEWLEAKLVEQGVEKVVPDGDTLAEQYRRSLARIEINRHIDRVRQQVRQQVNQATVPADLDAQVRELLAEEPSLSWDDAVTRIAEEANRDDD